MLKRFDRALLLRFLTEGAVRAGAIITLPLLTYFLGAAEYGKYALVLATTIAVVPIVSLGVGFSLIRQIASKESSKAIARVVITALALVSLVGIPLVLIVLVSAPEISNLIYVDESLGNLIRISSLLLMVSVWQGVVHEALRARQMTAFVSFLNIAEVTILPLSILLMVKFGDLKIPYVISIIAALRFLSCTIGLSQLFSFRDMINFGNWRLSVPEVRALLVIGLPFMVAGVGEWLMGLGDRLVIGAISGAAAVGVYSATQVMVSVLSSWGAPFWWVLFPRLCRQFEMSEPSAAYTQARKLVRLFLITGAAVAISLAIIGPEIVSMLFDDKEQVSRGFLILLLAATFINQAATPWEYAIYIEKKGKLLMYATLVWGGVAILLNILLLPSIGLAGAALSVLVGRLGFAAQIYFVASKLGHGREFAPASWELGVLLLVACTGVLVANMAVAALSVLAEISAMWGDVLTLVIFLLVFGMCYVFAFRNYLQNQFFGSTDLRR